jgi:predicted SAM-dependent methyltransferase
MTRAEKMLANISPSSQIGIEIGALNKPIITRQMGTIRYVDHATTEELRTKCAPWGTIDIATIVDVDYVWGDKSLAELTKAESPFDYVIASHVVEHVPDFIGWLKEIRNVLKTGGILSLAVPDKRFTYDYYRQLTKPADLIEAYLTHSKKPSPKQIFDYHAEFVRRKRDFAWRVNGFEHELVHEHTLDKAWEVTRDAFVNNRYVDVHCWVFTDASFAELLRITALLDMLDFTIKQFFPRDGHEFFVSLEAIDQNLSERERHKVQLESIDTVIKKLKNPLQRPLFDLKTWKLVHILRLIKRSLID